MENFREALNLAGMGIAVVFLGLALLILALLALGRIFKPVAVAAPQSLSLTDTQAWGAEPQELPPLPLTSTDLPETDIEEMVAIAAAMAATWQTTDAAESGEAAAGSPQTPSPWRIQGRQRFMSSQGAARGAWRR
jgi:Na+-transporting methylmalonyl-CoA/oxaloacetate decarboxylase gamma subunit